MIACRWLQVVRHAGSWGNLSQKEGADE
jgi:hypothetical protein